MNRTLALFILVIFLVSIIVSGCREQSPTPTQVAPAPTATPPATISQPTVPTTTPSQATPVRPAATPTTVATASPSPAVSKHGGILKIRAPNTPINFGFTFTLPGAGFFDAQIALEPLLRADENGLPEPWLAKGWEVDPNGKFITLFLEEGIKFHDGTDFDAAAVKYNLDGRRERAPGDVPGLLSIDVINRYTVRLNTSTFNIALFNSLYQSVGLMASPTQLAKGEAASLHHPVGTGPFKFVEVKRDSFTKFVRNENYWIKGLPYLDEVHMVVFPDTATYLAAFRAGEVHLGSVGAKDAFDLSKLGFPTVTKVTAIVGYAGDSANPQSPFSRLEVRQALDYAIDREAIAEALGYGYNFALTQYAPRMSLGWDPKISRPYDPAKAKQLLAKGGFPSGFRTRLIIPTGWGNTDEAALTQAYLRDVGIMADVVVVDQAPYLDNRQKSGWNNSLIYISHSSWHPHTGVAINRLWGERVVDFISTARPAGFHNLLNMSLTAPINEMGGYATKVLQLIHDQAMVLPIWEASGIVVSQKFVHDHGREEGINTLDWRPEKTWMSRTR
ncbi:MAG TPA: ABC transporter substrate-binding protein [Dehalococcoidales bacterium]|nr:ABC transporter substrate-binding protein [Dehalococcoidales bacterium]